MNLTPDQIETLRGLVRYELEEMGWEGEAPSTFLADRAEWYDARQIERFKHYHALLLTLRSMSPRNVIPW